MADALKRKILSRKVVDYVSLSAIDSETARAVSNLFGDFANQYGENCLIKRKKDDYNWTTGFNLVIVTYASDEAYKARTAKILDKLSVAEQKKIDKKLARLKKLTAELSTSGIVVTVETPKEKLQRVSAVSPGPARKFDFEGV